MTHPRTPSRRAVLGAAAWTAPVVAVATAAPAYAASTTQASVTSTSGDTSNRQGFVYLSLSPAPETTPAYSAAYDDPGAATAGLVPLGTDGAAGLYRFEFSTTTEPCPATITAAITLDGYGTTNATVLMAAPGTPDTTFTDPYLTNGRGVALQPDGKILVSGSFGLVGEERVVRRALARFNADGTVDTTFADPAIQGTNGYRVVLQPDGKVLVCGQFTLAGSPSVSRLRIARFHPDGTLDTSFANPNLNGTVCWSIALQPDGKVLAAGSFTTAGADNTARRRLARFNSDGTLDSSFADPNLNGVAQDVVVQADGKVLVVGSFTAAGSTGSARHNLARFNTDGTLDTSFADPNLSADAGGAAYAIALQPDGKVLVGGTFTTAGSENAPARGVARFHTDGTLDTTFVDPNLTVDPSTSGRAQSLALQPDGRVLVGGVFSFAGPDAAARRGVARFNADGTLDATFVDPNLDNGPSVSSAAGLLVLPSGKVLVSGSFTAVGTGFTTARGLARFNA